MARCQKGHVNDISIEAAVVALFKEFPWLEPHFCMSDISKISFRRINHSVMRENCQYSPGISDEFCEIEESLGKIIVLFSREGTYLGQVGRKKLQPFKFRTFIWWGKEYTLERADLFQEDIDTAIKRIEAEQSEKVHSIVTLFVDEKHLVISQPPMNSTIHEVLSKELQLAEENIQECVRTQYS